MALDTYSGLKAEIAANMHRDNLTAKIPGFITLAEADIGRKLRSWRMTSLESLSAAASNPVISLPARCRAVKWLKLSGTNERIVTSLPEAAFYKLYGQQGASNAQSGPPKHFFVRERSIVLGPTPDDDYTLTALCILAPVALSDSNPTNDILTYYPDLYLYGSLVHGFRYLRHTERMMEAKQAFMEAMNDANKESIKMGMSGTPYGIQSISRRRIV